MASRSVQKRSALVRAYLTVYDAADAPVTGLVNGDFTKRLVFNGANSAVVVTVAEVDSVNDPGVYMASFTPPTDGAWYLLVQNAANNPRGWEEEFDVTVDGVYTINEIFDKADGVETGFTLRQTQRLMAGVLCGKVSGGPGLPVFRNMQDTADRVSSTADANGNRTIVTLSP